MWLPVWLPAPSGWQALHCYWWVIPGQSRKAGALKPTQINTLPTCQNRAVYFLLPQTHSLNYTEKGEANTNYKWVNISYVTCNLIIKTLHWYFSGPPPYLLVANLVDVRRINPDGTEDQTLVEEPRGTIIALDYDPVQNNVIPLIFYHHFVSDFSCSCCRVWVCAGVLYTEDPSLMNPTE